jgi:hypothetical protein
MVDRSFNTPGFDGFQRTSHKSPRVSNWKTREEGWINGPRHLNNRQLGFIAELRASEILGYPYSPTFQIAQSLDCGIRFHVPSPDQW